MKSGKEGKIPVHLKCMHWTFNFISSNLNYAWPIFIPYPKKNALFPPGALCSTICDHLHVHDYVHIFGNLLNRYIKQES